MTPTTRLRNLLAPPIPTGWLGRWKRRAQIASLVEMLRREWRGREPEA